MRIAHVNIVPNGSTGKIMLQLSEMARRYNYTTKTYAPIPFNRRRKVNLCDIPNHMFWGSRMEQCCHYYMGTFLGMNGMLSKRGTKQLIRDLDEFKPDIIHLHNIHKFCINLKLLFDYIKEHHIRVIWTLHDCWAFTGHCAYFTLAKCDRWKTGCHHCPQPRVYPKMYRDTSRVMYHLKKKWFLGVEDMVLVTPSKWLHDLVKESFLKEYSTLVIHNGIDLSVFNPTVSNFREKYNIPPTKKIILGVAFGWSYRKGLDVFVELAKRLDSEKYQIVLVGTDERVDKQLVGDVISIHRTNDQKELAEIYSAADLFVNPTREENYPTVNMESVACGTPVLTFRTGGSPEMLDKNCGSVVDYDDIDSLEREVIRICEKKPFTIENCLNKAKMYDKNDRYEEYMKLYEDSTHST